MQRKIITSLYDWFKSESRKPLVMQGARQVGKSTSVRMFAKENNLNLFELNLEKYVELDDVFASLKIDKILRQIEGVLKRSLPTDSSSLLFLDEIQATPHALAALRYFYEESPDLPVIAAGSLLDFVLADHEFSMPVGRIEYLQVFPLSFDEYLVAREEHWLREQLISYKIGLTWPNATHDQLAQLLRDYMLTGGMPEVVAHRIKNPKSPKWQLIQENIIQTFQDDFAKYAKKHRVGVLRQIFDRIPQQIGKKVKYSQLAPHERAEQVRDSILLLERARIILRTFHTDASGIPLRAQKDETVFKCYMLDVGLYNSMMGAHQGIFNLETTMIHEGAMAEQFIAQHLTSFHGTTSKPELFYWLREGKTSNAEVDFLVQKGRFMIPVEVKARKAGAMKSLLHVMALRSWPLAVKFSLENPSLHTVSHQVATLGEIQTVTFDLLTLPLYFVEYLPMILDQWISGNHQNSTL